MMKLVTEITILNGTIHACLRSFNLVSQLGQDQLTSLEQFKLCFPAGRFSPEAISCLQGV